ncbi:MAG TPA: phosphoribosyltransferase family protein [Egibacteraceae bacterium]|nr:phosphoribosyltransferase family protein [Egibacteraceae bacterium]
MTRYADRRDAGRRLAEALRDHLRGETRRVVVLAIPRGGVPVAAEVAEALDAALDVVVVRKLRAPFQPELGYGAIGSDGHVDVDRDMAARLGLTEEQVQAEVADRRAVVDQRVREYRRVLPQPDLGGAVAVVVDDGIATGSTARQACGLARRLGAARVVLAAPVGPPDVEAALAGVADDVVVPARPPDFQAVGQAYTDFAQLDDGDVLDALRSAAGRV